MVKRHYVLGYYPTLCVEWQTVSRGGECRRAALRLPAFTFSNGFSMSQMIQFVANYDDLSTDKGFQFKFHCDRCRNGYLSRF